MFANFMGKYAAVEEMYGVYLLNTCDKTFKL